ncbi:hypothetical protein NBRC116602_17180 [Hyphomicrobiales bacterium 4NK60-0047b]
MNLTNTNNDQLVYIENGLISPTATFLEDIYESIQAYVSFLKHEGFNILITRDPDLVIDRYKRIGNRSLYSFDTKMDNVSNDIHGHRTYAGAGAGPATIASITNDGEDNQIEFCASLSEYDDIEEATLTINLLESNGQKIFKIHKDNHGNIDSFEKFANLYKVNFNAIHKPKILEEYFCAIEKSYGDISRHENGFPLLPTLLGYVDSDAKNWLEARNTGNNVYGEDLKDRIETLRYIKEGLMSCLGPDNLEEQLNWMYTKRQELNGKCAWDLLETGKHDDLVIVAALVNRILG